MIKMTNGFLLEDTKANKGLSLIEALVCLVIIGIGFVAVNQLMTFSISSMSHSIERNKVNFLAQMVVEDIIGDSDNLSSYTYNEACPNSSLSGSNLSGKQKAKWRDRFLGKNQMKIDGKDKKFRCVTGDAKTARINSADKAGATARFIYKTGAGKKKKYLTRDHIAFSFSFNSVYVIYNIHNLH